MSGQVAIVTGGARGLGREIVSALSMCGYLVCINYFESREDADMLVSELGDKAMAVRADVADCEQAAAMCRRVSDNWGRVDILVNNAGTTRDSLLIKLKEEDWDHIMAVNVKGVFNMMKSAVAFMKEGGHIVNISSYSGLKGKAGQAAYSASKAAILGLTKTAALELAESGIRVNAVLPGYMPTHMGISAAGALEAARKESMLHKLSDPKEVARFISYLVTTNCITGQTFILDSRII